MPEQNKPDVVICI